MVSNINDRSFLLEPDAEVCLPGTVERLADLQSKVVALVVSVVSVAHDGGR